MQHHQETGDLKGTSYMGKQSKTAVPSTSGRAKTTEPDRSTMKRTNNSFKLNAEEGPAIDGSSPAASVSTGTISIANSPSPNLTSCLRMKRCLLTQSYGAPRLRWSSTCVIELGVNTDYECVCGRGASSNEERKHWIGCLSDALDLQSGFDGHPIGEIFGDDDTAETRDAIVSQLQALAQALGYTHCEVRELSEAGEDDYQTVFGGIMTTEVEMYLH